MRRFSLLTLAALLVSLQAPAQYDPLTKVHPLVGTEKEGQTYPAVGPPFAMTQWTPQTRAGEVKCIAPYYFTDTKIQGFRGSHFLSGGCVPDYGSMTLMPAIGAMKTAPNDRASKFDRATEHATPYSYSVDLADAGIHAEITGTLRAGAMRFTAIKVGPASIVIENNARGGDGYVHVDTTTHEITGEVPVRREYAGTGKLAGFSGYFVIQFDQAFTANGTWVGTEPLPGGTTQTGDGKPLGVIKFPSSSPNPKNHTDAPRPGFGVYVEFGNVSPGKVILARIGTSFVSLDEARKNLAAEIPDWNYDAVTAQAKAAWQHALGLITVQDDIPATTVFYTSMYHAMLAPRTYSDVSGTYPGFAHEGKTEQANGFTYYDDFSMWDIFRAELPLITLLEPQREIDFVQSLIAKGREGGYLPIFPAWNSFTSEMIGDHGAVAITDAYRKGLRGFDINEAYALMHKNATVLPGPEDYVEGKGRRGLESYEKYGYIPLEDTIPEAFHKNEQVSRTLEYSFDDAILGKLAADLGKTEDAKLFANRGNNWRNVLDPSTGFARGRNADGTWVAEFDPTLIAESNRARRPTWITEASAWTYTYFVPQDVPGLIAFEGGNKPFIARLDEFFAKKHYDHGNEPSHHITYLYDAAGAPEKTQEHVRSAMESQYHDGPGGLAGNDDAGQMSAWYILSALGFYEVTPGVPEYWLGSPRFDLTTVQLPNGKTLRIEAKGAGGGKVYVRSVTLNGRKITGYKIQHSELAAGGVLHFEMSAAPTTP